jgi:hypothetical protein
MIVLHYPCTLPLCLLFSCVLKRTLRPSRMLSAVNFGSILVYVTKFIPKDVYSIRLPFGAMTKLLLRYTKICLPCHSLCYGS